MTTRNCLVGTLVGAIVLFFLGYAIYGVLLLSFFEANMGSATGVTREPFDFVHLAFGQVAFAGGLTTIIGWKKVSKPLDGFATGAIAGGLFFLGFDLTLYATTNLSTIVGALADAVAGTVLFGITGAIIVLAVGGNGRT